MRTKILIFVLLGCSVWNIQATDLSRDGGTLPNQGQQIGGKGADGNFHYLLLGNDGSLSVSSSGGGAVTVADGADVAEGAIADASVASGATGSVSAKLRRISATQTDGNQKVQVTTQIGAANYANGQVASSTTAGTLVASRATRRSVVIRNIDATISVYIGAATVSASNGMLVKAGESIEMKTTALIQVIAASGTPTVAYIEVYD